MADLQKQQDADRQDLAAGVYEAWQSLRHSEAQILSLYDGQRENVPAAIQEKMDKARTDYFEEWGSEGRLAALMAERHAEDRRRVAEQQLREQHISDRLNKKKDNDRDR